MLRLLSELTCGLFDSCHSPDECPQSVLQCLSVELLNTVPDVSRFLGNIVIFVKPVKASRGERVVLTTDVLLVLDGTDKAEELLYVITVPPVHGHLEYIKHPGLPIHTFSQMDIAANMVCYVHDNRATSPKETLQYGNLSSIITQLEAGDHLIIYCHSDLFQGHSVGICP